MADSWKGPGRLFFFSWFFPLPVLTADTHQLESHFQWFGLNTGSFVPQLLSCLEKRGLDTEGILRVPGSQARVKVMVWLPRLTEAAASPSILTCELALERIQVAVRQCPGFGLCLGRGILEGLQG